MKKLSILLIGLLLVTGFVFAQDVTVKGDATLTFGIDLDAQSTGFQNAASSSIALAWLSGDESKGETGWIKLTGWKISYASADTVTVAAPTVSAGFMFDPITVTIYSAPAFAADNAVGFTWHADDDPADNVDFELSANNTGDAAGSYGTTGTWYMFDVVEGDTADIPDNAILVDSSVGVWELYWVPDTVPTDTTTPGFQGLTFGVDLGMATVTLLVASDGTWAENTDNSYAFGGELSTTIDPLTLSAGVYAGPTDALDLGFTLGADAAVGPATVGLGFDGWLADGATDLDYDVSADIGVSTMGIGVTSNTYLWSTAGSDLELNQQVVLDLSGLAEGVGFTETFQMINLLSALEWYSLTEVSYTTGGIMPYASFGIDDASVMDVTAGVSLTGFVENTVFTLEYAAEDIANSNGAITAAAKISF
jgi:hypothetical protein